MPLPLRFLARLAVAALLVCASSLTASAAVTPYPRVPGDAVNPDYPSITVNGVPVDTVNTAMKVGYGHFAFTGKVKVEITAREPISTFDLSPHRLRLDAKAEGRVLSFELTEPKKLHLRINGLTRFFIFADAPETHVPQTGGPGVASVADFGVTSDPERTQTAALQRAIDETAAKRGTLVVPAGVYRMGRLQVKSGLSLYLAPGAVLKGTGKVADYPRTDGMTQQLHLGDAENVRIFGRGVIDGQGLALRADGKNSNASKARLITTHRSRHFTIDDVILRESAVWCVHMIESSDLRFTNLKLISMTRADAPGDSYEKYSEYGSNTDGFDPDNSSRILIDNTFISVDDDPIAIKLRNGRQRANMEDIQFRNNVVWTMCSALKIGTEVQDRTLRNVVFENNDVVYADRAIVAYVWRGGTVDGARWVNNHIEAVGTVPNDSPHKKEADIHITVRDVEGRGHIRNLLLKDNTFERLSPGRSLIEGLDAEHAVEGVTIDNLIMAGTRRTSAEAAGMTVGKHARTVIFR